MSLLDKLQTLNILALHRQVQALDERMESLEEKMTATDDVVTRLRAATDRLAGRIRDLTADDAETAAKFEPIVSELEAMGTQPDNPVPDPPVDQSADGDQPAAPTSADNASAGDGGAAAGAAGV